MPPTNTPTIQATPTKVPTRKPEPTSTPGPACPGWYQRPEPGRGILVIENHIGEDLRVEQILGGDETWQIAAKQGDIPGRLLLQLAPGDYEYVLYVTFGHGHIKLHVAAGEEWVSPVWFNYRYDEHIFPLERPPGCG
jgi:hypothetical protein